MTVIIDLIFLNGKFPTAQVLGFFTNYRLIIASAAQGDGCRFGKRFYPSKIVYYGFLCGKKKDVIEKQQRISLNF